MDNELLDLLQIKIKQRAPEFEIRYKNEDRWMKLLGKILFFNKRFMEGFVTTIGSKVYWPSRKMFNEFPDHSFVTLAHEYVHVMDNQKSPAKFKLGYLFPQILAALSLFSILAFISLWFLFFLAFLIFLAPIPAPFRKNSELRGYGMSIKARNWLYGGIDDSTMDHYVNQFTSGNYYYMWPFENNVRKELNKWNNNSVIDEPAFLDVYSLIQENSNK